MAIPENNPMTSEVSICNQALSWVGANSITSLADDSTEGRWCRENYDFLRDAVIESRMWTFAMARETSVVQDRDEWDQMFKHPVPENWISVFNCYRNVANVERPLPSSLWRKEGSFILASESTVYLSGVRRVTDTGNFSPLFVQCLAARLAADMAVPFSESRQLQVDMWGLYNDKLGEAAARDGQQGDIARITQHQLTDVRRW